MNTEISNLPPHRIGLSLSGGGAKGIAHAGVLLALEEYNLRPDIISGVSAGAIVGALYADGKTPYQICKFFQDSSFFEFAQLVIPRQGFMSSKRFERLLHKTLSSQYFEDLNIPFICNATEIVSGQNTYFHTGKLVEKVVASASFPIFLNPKRIDDKVYVDGGIFNNMPAEIIRKKCYTLIGVHVNSIKRQENVNNLSQIGERVYDLCIQSSTIDEMACCDLMIRPEKARKFGLFDIRHTQEIFDIGYKAAVEAISKWETRPL